MPDVIVVPDAGFFLTDEPLDLWVSIRDDDVRWQSFCIAGTAGSLPAPLSPWECCHRLHCSIHTNSPQPALRLFMKKRASLP